MSKPIANETYRAYLTRLGAKSSTPGGGCVAALNAAEAAALTEMVASYSGDEFDAAARASNELQARFCELAEDDMRAFDAVMRALGEGKGQDAALVGAATPPTRIIQLSEQLTDHLEQLAADGNRNLATDVGIAADLLAATLRACDLNILVNLEAMSSADEGGAFTRALNSSSETRRRLSRVSERIRERFSPP